MGLTCLPLFLFSLLLNLSTVVAFPADSASQAVLWKQYGHDEGHDSFSGKSEGGWKDGVAAEDGLTYSLFSHPDFADFRLRIVEPKLCDPDVQQYSGYLDISDGKHLFFWFFESRSSPKTDPLILWLNGGPGCSSSTGLLFELGPCSVTNEGLNVTYNQYSWNTKANIIFLDQPINVGFSYSDDGSKVNNTPVAAVDVYAFVQLFLIRFAKYRDAAFHLAAESYGGTYGPHIASFIHKKNVELDNGLTKADALHVNLASVILANGYTNPYIQAGKYAEYVCTGPYALYDDPDGPECRSLRRKMSLCQRLIKACYDYNTRIACTPADMYCDSIEGQDARKFGLNPFDLRVTCGKEDGSTCFKQMDWIEVYLNAPEIKKELGADSTKEFKSCNPQVGRDFQLQGDEAHNSAILLPELVNAGVKLLVYAGITDSVCDYMGNEAWLEELDTELLPDFLVAPTSPWINAETGAAAGTVRSAGDSGNITFVVVYEAGHMVPFNQPGNALDLISRWINDVPISSLGL